MCAQLASYERRYHFVECSRCAIYVICNVLCVCVVRSMSVSIHWYKYTHNYICRKQFGIVMIICLFPTTICPEWSILSQLYMYRYYVAKLRLYKCLSLWQYLSLSLSLSLFLFLFLFLSLSFSLSPPGWWCLWSSPKSHAWWDSRWLLWSPLCVHPAK